MKKIKVRKAGAIRLTSAATLYAGSCGGSGPFGPVSPVLN